MEALLYTKGWSKQGQELAGEWERVAEEKFWDPLQSWMNCLGDVIGRNTIFSHVEKVMTLKTDWDLMDAIEQREWMLNWAGSMDNLMSIVSEYVMTYSSEPVRSRKLTLNCHATTFNLSTS
jgi:hypothetical protein